MTGHDDAPIWDGLTRHLDDLGAAAPPPALATVVTRRAASSTATRFELGGLSVAVVLVALVAVAIGPRAGSSAPPVTVVRDGNFTLELRADSATYGTDQPITGVVATLTYVGPDPSVTISHADSVMGFGIVEPVHGWTLQPGWLQSCRSSVLTKGVGVTAPFGKSGSSLTDDPAFVRFMQDPVLRLPAGSWHLYVEASFNEGDCGAGGPGAHDIKAQITIVVGGVGPVPTAAPESPTAVPTGPAASTPANTPTPSGVVAAGAFVDRYIRALVNGDYSQAWSLLGVENQGGFGSLAGFTSERKAFFDSVAGRYTIIPNPTDVEPITGWVNGTNVPALDLSTAVLVEVDYPNLAGNNAGWELYVVTPTADGLRLYQVR